MNDSLFTKVFNREFSNLIKRYPSLEVMKDSLSESCKLMIETVENGGKILCCGNGGSASDAEHIVGELLKSFMAKRPVDEEMQKSLTDKFSDEGKMISENLQGYIPAISLMGHTSLSTAFANDVNPDFIIAQQAYALGNKGDLLVSISTSGNSKNVIWASKVAIAKGIKVIGLTGKNGGKLRGLSDILLDAPADVVYEIQELHLPIYHAFCLVLESYFFPQ